MRTSSLYWPTSQMVSACHMCVPLSSFLQGSRAYWPDFGRENRVHRGFFYFDESLNRAETGGGVKGKKYNSFQPCPPSTAALKHSDIISHRHRAFFGLWYFHGGWLLHTALCHKIKRHVKSIFKLPLKNNGEKRRPKDAHLCARWGGGWVRYNGSSVEETWDGCILGLYIHTPVSSIPFSLPQCTPCPLNCLTTLDPSSGTLLPKRPQTGPWQISFNNHHWDSLRNDCVEHCPVQWSATKLNFDLSLPVLTHFCL